MAAIIGHNQAYCKAKLALMMCDTFMVCITYAAQANVQHKYDLTGCAHRRKPVVSTGLQRIRLSDKYAPHPRLGEKVLLLSLMLNF